MEWMFWVGILLLSASVGLLAMGTDRLEFEDGLPPWARVSLVIVSFVGLLLLCVGQMTETFRDAIDRNPYQKEYLYKQLPDGTMEKYDSLYVLKR